MGIVGLGICCILVYMLLPVTPRHFIIRYYYIEIHGLHSANGDKHIELSGFWFVDNISIF